VPARRGDMFGVCPVFVKLLSSNCSVSIKCILDADSDGVVAFMDDRLKDILDTLPTKSPRSRLEPYREFIQELRRRGRTYRDIASILSEKCQVKVSASGIHDFVRTRSRREQKAPKRSPKSMPEPTAQRIETTSPAANADASVDEVRRKIAALKARKSVIEPTPEGFRFDPSEPLRLKNSGSNTADE